MPACPRHRAAVAFVSLLALLCGAACARSAQTGATEQFYAPSAFETTELCRRSTAPGYSNPEVLAREYVRRDGSGELASSRTNHWFLDAHYCPGGLPGWDIVTIVKEARIDSVVIADFRAHAYVTYRRLGSADAVSFTPALGNVQASLPMVRTEDGWRLNAFQNPHFLLETALAWPTFAWPDSVRALINRLARH